MKIINLETITVPTLLIDEQRARNNIYRMAQKARLSQVIFRPHFKTHQSAEIGTWFRDEDVKAITVSSVDMAAYFALAGWQDITIAFPINIRQSSQISHLAGQIKLGVVVENLDALKYLGDHLSNKVRIWLKIDTGTHRTGIPTKNTDLTFKLLSEIQKHPRMEMVGILTHAGSTYKAQSPHEIIQQHVESTKQMIELQNIIEASENKKPLISIGDTPGCSLMTTFEGVDEIRPGNFIFYDSEQLEIGSCSQDDISVALACPIVAKHPERNEIVVYGGAVHLSKEFFSHQDSHSFGLVALPNQNGWGKILPECYVIRVSQEHGILSITDDMFEHFRIGDLAMVIPAHSCLTAHLMRRYTTLDGRTIEMMPI